MPEFQHTEWKATWKDDSLKWIWAFANTEGRARFELTPGEPILPEPPLPKRVFA